MTDEPDIPSDISVSADDASDEFDESIAEARELLDTEDITAFHVGVIRGGEDLDSTYAYRADEPEQEGFQALSLLASHLRIVASEAGLDYETVASDAASLAEQFEEREQ